MEESPVKPVTLDEAVDWLRWYLEAEDIAAIAAQDEDELLDHHFDTCLLIRNAFSLWDTRPCWPRPAPTTRTTPPC